MMLLCCALCQESKADTEYSFRNGKPISRCKACVAELARAWYANNKERSSARGKAYRAAHAERLAEAGKEWVAANRERVLAAKARYREAHKEALAVRQKERFAANPEKRRAAVAKWDRANREKCRRTTHTRRAKRLNATTAWDGELDALVFQEAARLACLREKTTGFGWDVDHVEPLQGKEVCGLHNAYNLAVVPRSYNHSKGNRRIAQTWIDAL
jgi:hypothetical protein